MADHLEREGPAGIAEQPSREAWGTRLGFILAAVGSAVGLGNMWRFPYLTAEGGGAAFVLLYIGFTLAVGIPLMLAEFAVGRRAGLSPIGALRKLGGAGWVPVGFLFVLVGLVILSYYSVIAGWTVRYSLDALVRGFPGDAGARFAAVATGVPAVTFHVLFMAVTIAIVMGGVKRGIERASFVLMPLLFLILVGLALWAWSLEGSGAGYGFYLKPAPGELFNAEILADAASQAFFSLSLGMGAMLTYASYLSRGENLPREAGIIAGSDFSVAFVAGLVVFPVIFALGLSGQVSESTVGALFISLPGAFASMGAVGRIVGLAFFVALVVGALTSAISLLEVVTASVIDEWRLPRRAAGLGTGILATVLGLWPATSLYGLGALDQVAGNLCLAVGGFFIAVFVGWRMDDPVGEVTDGSSPGIRRLVPGWRFTLRYIVPPIMLVVVYYQLRATIALFAGS